MTQEGDFTLSPGGRLQLEVDPLVAAAIKLRHRFSLFKGEWFLDSRQGIPYYDVVFLKNPNLELIRRMLRRVILSCPPITAVQKAELFFASKERTLIFIFEATGEDGRIVKGGIGTPFIVETDGVEVVVS